MIYDDPPPKQVIAFRADPEDIARMKKAARAKRKRFTVWLREAVLKILEIQERAS